MNTEGITQRMGRHLDLTVFAGSAVLVIPFVLLGAVAPALLKSMSGAALGYLTQSWSWLYLSSVNLFVVAALALALSPYGKIRLGRDDEKPEYGWLSWFAMLFSAGMGIGLVFWSIAEPLYHYASPPKGVGSTAESARLAFQIFCHHWGIHAWGTYVAVGLPLAYFQFRKGLPGTVSHCLFPRGKGSGEKKATRRMGKLVDMLAVWATVMGVVTSLGLGALQITSGLHLSWGIPGGVGTTAAVIGVITVLYITSALSGVKRGIRMLSLLNVALMVLLLLFFMVKGPFGFILKTLGVALSDYATGIIPLSTTFSLFGNRAWTEAWTVFYWAWWIAWAPFVGAFIATISRGRTIREFVLGVMFLPALFSILFSTALGGTAIWLELEQGVGLVRAVSQSLEAALFETLAHLPLYGLLAFLANLLIASFFITSADSATLVISRFSTGGLAGGPETTDGKLLIVFWGLLLGGLAMVLIWSGGLKALQTASIIGAFPFVFVMFFLLISLTRELVREGIPKA
ncbi:BCCT family transporter [Desulfoluna sp.]|uniref:BCCT family transporter n=1 Tax=Desulfoluna sp. TaxID=2045199 RepID=UPI0026238038|nr:BCCT family transporter [Desulfoluna sp.]